MKQANMNLLAICAEMLWLIGFVPARGVSPVSCVAIESLLVSKRLRLATFSLVFLSAPGVLAQSTSPSTGEVTVRLTQGLDSMTSPNGVSEGKVTKSTNPEVPVGSTVTVGVSKNESGGGVTARLINIGLGGKNVPANSSAVVAAPDFFSKAQEKIRAAGQPHDAVSGPRVYLPERMIIRFTLAEPSHEAIFASNAPKVLTPTTPSYGPVGGPAFNPQTAPNLSIPAVDALALRLRGAGGMTTVVQPGLEDGMSTFVARENVIVDGAIQPAPPGFFRGMRGIRLSPGQTVQLLDIRAMDDGEHDILHLMLTDNLLPTFGNIAFAFPKGQLATLTEPALEKIVAPFFTIPARQATPSSGNAAATSSAGEQHVSFVLEGIGLGMSLDQIRTAAKAAGGLRPPVKQGPVTYNVRTRDLAFQLEFSTGGMLTQYNVSAINPRHLKETSTSGPLYNHLVGAFGPPTAWGKQVIYDGEDSYYAIISDLSHF